MDLRILGWTAITVLFKRDVAVHRSTGCLALRRRPPQLAPESLQADGLQADGLQADGVVIS
jgi:hypothetical protein